MINNEVNNMALIRKSEYARKQGFSRSYVSKLIKQGKISVCEDMIDEDKMNTRADLKKTASGSKT
jgi:16S rRNA U516 pseudouridylate synthase RsuA-like enzyme